MAIFNLNRSWIGIPNGKKSLSNPSIDLSFFISGYLSKGINVVKDLQVEKINL